MKLLIGIVGILIVIVISTLIGFCIGVVYAFVQMDDYIGPGDNLEEMEHKYEVSNYSKDS